MTKIKEEWTCIKLGRGEYRITNTKEGKDISLILFPTKIIIYQEGQLDLKDPKWKSPLVRSQSLFFNAGTMVENTLLETAQLGRN